MIERYANREIGSIWCYESRIKRWLEVEILICEALAIIGEIPQKASDFIRKNAVIDVKRIKEIEKKLNTMWPPLFRLWESLFPIIKNISTGE